MVALSVAAPASAEVTTPPPAPAGITVVAASSCDYTTGKTTVKVTVTNNVPADFTISHVHVTVGGQRVHDPAITGVVKDAALKSAVIVTKSMKTTVTPGVLEGKVVFDGTVKGDVVVSIWTKLVKPADEAKPEVKALPLSRSGSEDGQSWFGRQFDSNKVTLDGHCKVLATAALTTDCGKLTVKLTNPAKGYEEVTFMVTTKAKSDAKPVVKFYEVKSAADVATVKTIPLDDVSKDLTGLVKIVKIEDGHFWKASEDLLKTLTPLPIKYVEPANCAPAQQGALPTTGAKTGLIAGGAAILLAIGGGLFLIARRRRITFTS